MYNTNQRNNTYKSLFFKSTNESRSSSTHYVICILKSLNSGCFLPTSQDSTTKKLRQIRPSNQINLKWMMNKRAFVGLVGFLIFWVETYNYEESWNLPEGFFLLHPFKLTKQEEIYHGIRTGLEVKAQSSRLVLEAYKGSIIHESQTRQCNECYLKHVIPAIQQSSLFNQIRTGKNSKSGKCEDKI